MVLNRMKYLVKMSNFCNQIQHCLLPYLFISCYSPAYLLIYLPIINLGLPTMFNHRFLSIMFSQSLVIMFNH